MSDLSSRILNERTALALKTPCRCATVAPITLSGFQTIDGVTLAASDTNLRVLVKDQADATTNGLYVAQSSTWKRDYDFADPPMPTQSVIRDVLNGTRVYVQQGTVNGSRVFSVQATDPIIFAPTALTPSSIAFIADTTFLNAGIECAFDGGGNPLTVGMTGHIEIPFAATLLQGTLVAAPSGALTVDVRKCTFAQYDGGVTHPVAADSITGSSPLALAAATKSQNTTLSGWTTALNKGDIIEFTLTAVDAVIVQATASLRALLLAA